MMEKVKLLKECREQEVGNNTFCLWQETTLGMPPMCSMYVGGWFWNDKFETLVKCYKEVILWDSAAMVCGYDDYVTDEKSTIELLEICANDFNTSFANKKTINNIVELLKTSANDLDEFNNFVEEISKLFKQLGVHIFTDVYVGFDAAYEWIYERLDGVVPVYNTAKEYLLNDEV